MVKAHALLADHLGINQVKVFIGGSLGGQQALEWSISEPHKFENLIVVATNALHSPWGIAFNESQRLAITTDRTFYAQHPDGGLKGLKVARSIALLSYRTYDAYTATQVETVNDKTTNFRASSYQTYQGEKLCKRFNAYSYWYLSKAMDSHNVGRVSERLGQLRRRCTVWCAYLVRRLQRSRACGLNREGVIKFFFWRARRGSKCGVCPCVPGLLGKLYPQANFQKKY